MKKGILLLVCILAICIQIHAADEPNKLVNINMEYYAMLHSKLPPAFTLDLKKDAPVLGACLGMNILGGIGIYKSDEMIDRLLIGLIMVAGDYFTVKSFIKKQ